MRIRYVAEVAIDVGSTVENIVSYRGAAGEAADVPDDVAAILIDQGAAELAEPAKPAKRKPAKPAA